MITNENSPIVAKKPEVIDSPYATQWSLSSVYGKMVLVFPQIQIWTGTCVLKEADIEIGDGGKLPPKELAQLGRKKIYSSEELRVFDNIKNRVCTLLGTRGVTLFGGYAIGNDAFQEIKPALDLLIADFHAEVDKLALNYQAHIEDWKKDLPPEYAEAVSRDQLSVGEVKKRLQAGYTVARISPVDGDTTLDTNVSGLFEKLVVDINKSAMIYMKNSLTGVTEATGHSIKKIRSLMQKAQSLTFVGPKGKALALFIEQNLAAFDQEGKRKGKIEGAEFQRMKGFFSILSNKNALLTAIDGVAVDNADLPMEEAEQPAEQTATAECPAPVAAPEPVPAEVEQSDAPAQEQQSAEAVASEPVDDFDRALDEACGFTPQAATQEVEAEEALVEADVPDEVTPAAFVPTPANDCRSSEDCNSDLFGNDL